MPRNIFTERLWRKIKYEEVYMHEFASPKEAYRNWSAYINYYNYDCPHQALDYQPPPQTYGGAFPYACGTLHINLLVYLT
jgi:putative transposase